jgi:hypothetical protein
MVSEIQRIRNNMKDLPATVIMKNARSFTKLFLPDYTTGIVDVHLSRDDIEVIANVKLHHVPSKGKAVSMTIDMDRYNAWKDNLNLIKFIQ